MSRTSFVTWSGKGTGAKSLFRTWQGYRNLWWVSLGRYSPVQSASSTSHEESLEIAVTDIMLPKAIIAGSFLF